MPMRTLVVFILTVFIQCNGFAQQTVLHDTSAVQVRGFATEKLNAYKSDPKFQYNKTPGVPASLWDRFWDWFWSLVRRILGSAAGYIAFYWIILPLTIAAIVFFILKITGMTDGLLFRNK